MFAPKIRWRSIPCDLPQWHVVRLRLLCGLLCGLFFVGGENEAYGQNTQWVFQPNDAPVQPIQGVPGVLRPVPSTQPYPGQPYPVQPYPAQPGGIYYGAPPQIGVFRLEGLPRETLYPAYIADLKASRLGSVILQDDDSNNYWDVTLGGRFGLLRFGNDDREWPSGWQLDVEGSAMLRMDLDMERDAQATDYRAGIPLSFSMGPLQTRVGYYHLSAHLGDEFLLKNPGYPRLNYTKDVVFAGASYWWSRSTRIYGEAGYAFYREIGGPWEFQFGLERAPRQPTGPTGAPFYAIGVQLYEETDFSPNFNFEAGWAWRAWQHTGMLRAGVQLFSGRNPQFSFYEERERFIGLGLWYDF